MRILIAEDEPEIAQMVKFKLEREGFDVIWECNGGLAFKAAQDDHPDLILLDIMMPVMDGFQVLKKLKSDEELKDIPVIMLTAKGQERDIVTGMEAGANDYVVKPFRPAELVARIKKILSD